MGQDGAIDMFPLL